MLKIENFTKKYGDKTAVSQLDLTIGKGEIYGFIGHNGAGKTTTIKAVAGIRGKKRNPSWMKDRSILMGYR